MGQCIFRDAKCACTTVFIWSRCKDCALYIVNDFNIQRSESSGKQVFNAKDIYGIVFRFLVGLYWILIGRFNIGDWRPIWFMPFTLPIVTHVTRTNDNPQKNESMSQYLSCFSFLPTSANPISFKIEKTGQCHGGLH